MGRVHGVLDLWIYFSNLWFVNIYFYSRFQIPILIFISEISAWRLVFWNSIHMEVASGPFCLLVHSPWPLVFALCLFELFLSFVNLYCRKGLHFSWSNSLIFIFIVVGLVLSFHFWFRDLLRELAKKYEILLIFIFLLFLLFLASEALLFISFFWASFHSLCSPTLGICFGEGFYLPDPCELTFANTLLLTNAAVSLGGAFVSLEISLEFYIFVFFFLTGLHFFHLLFGLLLLGLFFWSCSFP